MQPNNPYYPESSPQQPMAGPPQPQVAGGIPPVIHQAPPTGTNGAPKKNTAALFLTIGILGLLLLCALIFGVWAYGGKQDYKNNSDQKVAVAVAAAKKAATDETTQALLEEQKKDTKMFKGPSQYGSVTIAYPKIWSGYVATDEGGSNPLVALFHPDVVPAVTANKDSHAIALKVEVVNDTYDNVVDDVQQYVDSGEATAAPYALPKMPKQVGLKVTGKISEQFNGELVILPLRDKTLILTTQTDQYTKDFEKIILPNVSYEP